MENILGNVISGLSLFVAFLVYERTKSKDNVNIGTQIAILMTKVDSMLSLSNDVTYIKEKVIRHDEEIKNLKDTNRFAKITDEMIKKERVKND
jgi:hypothetical protein